MDRIATFKQFIADKPEDPFPRYGLAMEYKKQGQLDDACAAFAELTAKFPDYVPTYLMYGNTLEALERAAEADAIYRKGIEVSTATGDGHARNELEAALADLGYSE